MASEKEPYQLSKVLAFMSTLWVLDHELRAASKHMGSSLGVTGPQRLVIRLVGKFPGICAKTIAELLHIHPSTLTGVLSRLESAGFIIRTPDPEDRRRVHFHLTESAKKINAMSAGTVEAAVRRAISHFTEEQLELTQEVLAKISKELSTK
jgi:DNA-binding MarR family transcriptional regulator